MVNHPIGCGKRPISGVGEEWEHWMLEDGVVQHHCDWDIVNVIRGNYTCSWGASSVTSEDYYDGIFHKTCLQREGFVW